MFGGFKASLSFFGKSSKKGVHSELTPDMTVSGAYRTSRDDSFGYKNSFDQSKPTASEQFLQQIRPTKSAADLTKVKNVPQHLRHGTAEVSRDPRGAPQDEPRNGAQNAKLTKNQEKEQKKLEKLRLAEQKAREKQAAQERAKQEQLRREREKKEAPVRPKRERKSDKKKAAPQPQAAVAAAAAAPTPQQYSSNTLESSISRSSGPPPYSDVPTPKPRPGRSKNTKTQSDNDVNVTFSKPEDTGSWDMVSQHRQQTIRPTAVIGGGSRNKQMVMDLNYNFGTPSETKVNSDA